MLITSVDTKEDFHLDLFVCFAPTALCIHGNAGLFNFTLTVHACGQNDILGWEN